MPNLVRHAGNAVAYANVIGCLFAGPHTVFELHAETGLALTTIRKLMTALKRRKLIYIAAWERDSTPAGRYTIPAYAFGTKPDVKRPRPQTPTQRSAALAVRKRMAALYLQPTKGKHEALQDTCA